jgi:DNA-directed RNA polymerase specialized sigma24 family protein
MTPQKQKIIKAKKIYGYNYSEIGSQLGISKQAVHEKLTKEERSKIDSYRKEQLTKIFNV